MAMTDYIRKAVELADGWDTTRMGNQRIKVFAPHGEGGEHPLTDIGYIDQQHVIDALAAQLVRQVDALNSDVNVFIYRKLTEVGNPTNCCGVWPVLGESEGPDRTMNTIRAIVDSGVLE